MGTPMLQLEKVIDFHTFSLTARDRETFDTSKLRAPRRVAMRRHAIPGLVGLLALAARSPAERNTYRLVNEQGIVTYSDQPPQVRPIEGEREALIGEALEISGTKKSLETIPAHIRAQFDARQTPLKPEEKTRVVKILGDAFR